MISSPPPSTPHLGARCEFRTGRMSGEKGTGCIDRNVRDEREKKKDVQQKCSGWMFCSFVWFLI